MASLKWNGSDVARRGPSIRPGYVRLDKRRAQENPDQRKGFDIRDKPDRNDSNWISFWRSYRFLLQQKKRQVDQGAEQRVASPTGCITGDRLQLGRESEFDLFSQHCNLPAEVEARARATQDASGRVDHRELISYFVGVGVAVADTEIAISQICSTGIARKEGRWLYMQ
jgi:hypothetical protein